MLDMSAQYAAEQEAKDRDNEALRQKVKEQEQAPAACGQKTSSGRRLAIMQGQARSARSPQHGLLRR